MLLPVPNLPLCDWSSQLFDLRAPSSTVFPVLLLNQPNIRIGVLINKNTFKRGAYSNGGAYWKEGAK